MRLPNAEDVVIDERKIRDYLLSKTHPLGRFKARFFSGLGFGPGNWELLANRLRQIALRGDAEAGEVTKYGRKYLISGTLTGTHDASADVVTVWFVPEGHDKARLVTVYPR